MKKICVFCSSRDSIAPLMLAEAKRLGQGLATRGYELVYGGAQTGAMGAIANSCLEANGVVTGIFPRVDLGHEKPHEGLANLVTVDSMWERKKRLARDSDGFVVFPGGTGTLDEFFEILVLRQLSDSLRENSIVFEKPIVVLNLFGFWDPMLEMMKIYEQQGFIDPKVEDHYHVVETVEEVFEGLSRHFNPTSRNA